LIFINIKQVNDKKSEMWPDFCFKQKWRRKLKIGSVIFIPRIESIRLIYCFKHNANQFEARFELSEHEKLKTWGSRRNVFKTIKKMLIMHVTTIIGSFLSPYLNN
jgi:hypothetical protein